MRGFGGWTLTENYWKLTTIESICIKGEGYLILRPALPVSGGDIEYLNVEEYLKGLTK